MKINKFITGMLKYKYEADSCSLEEMMNINNKLNEKIECKRNGIYFILNNGEDLIKKNLGTINSIYHSKDENEYKFLKENQYDVNKILSKKLDILKVLSEEESPILKDMQKILYIGKAGGKVESDLYNRLKLYMEYGNGKPRNHKGGRAIWQIKKEKRKDLKVYWIYLPKGEPCENAEKIEKYLLKEYNKKVCECLEKNENYRKYLNESKIYMYPFANWRN